jgi:hypothetical protein
MMAVRIMTQSLFPRIFPGVYPYVYVSSNYREIVFLGNAPIPKYRAPRHRPFNQLAPDGNKGSPQSVWISPEKPKITNADLGPLMLHASDK